MIKKIRRVVSYLAVILAAPLAVCADEGKSPVISDVPLRIDRTIVIAAHMQGPRIVAVGERGAVFISEDEGKYWKPFRMQKTTRTLTSVVALNDKVWIGAGHGGFLLRSDDGARSAELIETEAGSDSFLGLTVLSPDVVLAYGAFGLMLRSEDAGKTWKRIQVIDEEFDRHIASVLPFKGGLLLVGESGSLAKSTDGGLTWKKLAPPYEGSFFGATVTPKGALLIYGMRGNVYRSEDDGNTWQKIELASKLPFFGASSLKDGTVILTAGLGWLAISDDDAKTFRLKRISPRSISGAFQTSSGDLVVYGELGVRLFPINTIKN